VTANTLQSESKRGGAVVTLLKGIGRALLVAAFMAAMFAPLSALVAMRYTDEWRGSLAPPVMRLASALANVFVGSSTLAGVGLVLAALALIEALVAARLLRHDAAKAALGERALSCAVTAVCVAPIALPVVDAGADPVLVLVSGLGLFAALFSSAEVLSRGLLRARSIRPEPGAAGRGIRSAARVACVGFSVALVMVLAGLTSGRAPLATASASLQLDSSWMPPLDLVVAGSALTLLLRAAVRAALARSSTPAAPPERGRQLAWTIVALLPVGVLAALAVPAPASARLFFVPALPLACLLAYVALRTEAFETASPGVAALVLSLLFAAGLAAIALRWRAMVDRDRQLLQEVRELDRLVSGVPRDWNAFYSGREAQRERLSALLPAVPRSEDLAALERLLQSLAYHSGVHLEEFSTAPGRRDEVVESKVRMQIRATQPALDQLLLLIPRYRPVRFDDVFLSDGFGSVAFRVFSMPPVRPVHPVCRNDWFLEFPKQDLDWIFSSYGARVQLWRRCILSHQQREYVADARLVAQLEEFLGAPAAKPQVRTEPTASDLTAGIFAVSRIERTPEGWKASVGGPGRTFSLRAGDALANGVVRAVAADHVIVEAKLPPFGGKPASTRLLRFSAPQRLRAISVGTETTRITTPLLPDGTPDYGKWLNGKYGEGVTTANNAAPLLFSKRTELVDAGQTFFDDSPGGSVSRWYSEPWKEAECPACAARLARNAGALAAVAEAVRRPRYFEPSPQGTRLGEAVPSLLRIRHYANALAARGMLRLGRGDVAGARDDALAVEQLASRLGEGHTLIHRLIAIACQGIGAPLVGRVAAASTTRDDAQRLLAELRELPAVRTTAEALDDYERLSSLDRLLIARDWAAERGTGVLLELDRWWSQIYGKERVDPLAYLIPPSAFDWDEALRLINRQFDLAVAAARAETREGRRAARAAAEAGAKAEALRAQAVTDALKGSVGAERTRAGAVGAASLRMAQTPQGRKELSRLLVSPPDLGRAVIAWNEGEAVTRIQVTAAALFLHRFETGDYASRLDGLPEGLLRDRFARPGVSPGYALTYVAAPGQFALTAHPEERTVTGHRAFCTDSTGVTRFTIDGTAPRILNGLCDPKAPLLR
jgi:hypothetical protein